MKPFALILFISFCLMSCAGMSVDNVIGDYYIVCMDYDKDDASLSYKVGDESYVGLVNEGVYAVGNNQRYIIVKQKKQSFKGITEENSSYYIVTVKNKKTYHPEKGVLGPYNKNEFDSMTVKLGISDIPFSKYVN